MFLNSVFKVFNLLGLIIILSFTNTSCVDKCRDTICENGVCVKGDCFCDNGYSGELCDVAESYKFVGDYNGSMTCEGDSEDKKITISDVKGNPWDITLFINNNNTVEFKLKCHIKGDSLFIEKQFVEKIHIGGSTVTNLIYETKGSIQKDSILDFEFTYKNVESGGKFTCEIHAVKIL